MTCFSQWDLSRSATYHFQIEPWRASAWFMVFESPCCRGQGSPGQDGTWAQALWQLLVDTYQGKRNVHCFKPLSFGEWFVSYFSVTWPILTSTVPEWINEWVNTVNSQMICSSRQHTTLASATTGPLRLAHSQQDNKPKAKARTVCPGERMQGKVKDLLMVSQVQSNSVARSHTQRTPSQSELFV